MVCRPPRAAAPFLEVSPVGGPVWGGELEVRGATAAPCQPLPLWGERR